MSDKDRFLIAMPTRNREAIVKKSLSGLLDIARRDDVRLLISDNSDAPTKGLREFCDENSVDYIRPERVLRMTDHWNWIMETQDYRAITITTDRSMLWHDVYLEAKKLAEETGSAVVAGEATYIRKRRLGIDFGVLSAQVKSGSVYRVPVNFVRDAIYKNLVHTALPLPQNSIHYKHEIDKIFKLFGGLNCFSPDYELGYKYVHTFEGKKITLLDKAMTISHSKDLSNGGAFSGAKHNDAGKDFLLLNSIKSYPHSPFPNDLDSFSAVAHELNKILIEIGKEPVVKPKTLLSVRERVLDRRQTFFERRKKFFMTLMGIDPDHLLKIRLGYDPLDARDISVPVNSKLKTYRPFFI